MIDKPIIEEQLRQIRPEWKIRWHKSRPFFVEVSHNNRVITMGESPFNGNIIAIHGLFQGLPE